MMERQVLHSSANAHTSRPKPKRGLLDLGFRLGDNGRSIMHRWERRAPLIVQQELYFDRNLTSLPCVYILSSGGPILSSDSFEQHFEVEQGAMAHISTGAATKVAEMSGGEARMESFFTLHEGAFLEYLPEPTIPCRGSRFRNLTHIAIAPSATLIMAEIYLSGRKFHGESFEFAELELHTRAKTLEGILLFNERMILAPDFFSPRSVGLMGDYDIYGSVVVLTPPKTADQIYENYQNLSSETLISGLSRLPNECGLQLKLLGKSSIELKREVRRFCSLARLCTKQKPLPEEFCWR